MKRQFLVTVLSLADDDLNFDSLADKAMLMSGVDLVLAFHHDVTASKGPVRPARHGEFGMYAGGHWHRFSPRPGTSEPTDPVARLDVSLLSSRVLSPLLGIGDLRTDKRVDFVGGGRGLGELEKRVDSGEMAAAFSLYPTRLDDLMAVADAGAVMPPKSTWFEPKLADGLLAYVLD